MRNNKDYTINHIKTRLRLRYISTLVLFLIPLSLGFFLMIIWDMLVGIIHPQVTPIALDRLLFCSVFFLWGLSTLIFVVRKELPPLPFFHIQGIAAIIIGLVFSIMFWGLALDVLVDMIAN